MDFDHSKQAYAVFCLHERTRTSSASLLGLNERLTSGRVVILPPSRAENRAVFPDPVEPLISVSFPDGKMKLRGPRQKREGAGSPEQSSHSKVASLNPISFLCWGLLSQVRVEAQSGTSPSERKASIRCIDTWAMNYVNRILGSAISNHTCQEGLNLAWQSSHWSL